MKHCWCESGVCHACHSQRTLTHVCMGCGHRFCFSCAHRLDSKRICVDCATKWLNLMTSLDLPKQVAAWFNEVTL